MQLSVPPLQPPRQLPNLPARQHPGLHPADRRLCVHLVYRPPHQLQTADRKSATQPRATHIANSTSPQRLHHQVLHLVQRQPRLLRNRLERHRPVVRVPLEHRLDQRHQADLLPQERVVLLQDRLLPAHTSAQSNSHNLPRLVSSHLILSLPVACSDPRPGSDANANAHATRRTRKHARRQR